MRFVRSRSAIETRARGPVASDDARMALMRELEFYPTPPWAARAGGELIAALDPEARTIWEPACGEGHMAGPLAETFKVRASDIHDHGYGEVIDFLGDRTDTFRPDWVVTNPPFALGKAFVETGLNRARHGVAMLCRLAFVETDPRAELIERLSLQAAFSERVDMRLGWWDPELSTQTAYAWFIWMHPAAEARSPLADVIWANRMAGGWHSRVLPPGTKERLWAVDDAEVYGGRERLAA